MAITNVAYTQLGKAVKDETGYRHFNFKIAFGDGVQTYGTGVQLSFGKIGCPTNLNSFNIYGNNSGYVLKFDPVTAILHLYQEAGAAGPLAELAAGDTPAALTIYAEAVGY